MGNLKSGNLFILLVENLIWVLVLVAVVIFSMMSDNFLSMYNLVNIFVRVAALGLLVIGQSFTLITGNFDLSSESTMGLTAMVGGLLIAAASTGGLDWKVNPLIAIAVMLVLGCLIGLINGLLITRLMMNNLIVTVAMLLILRGVTYVISPGQSTSFFPELFNFLGSGFVYRIPLANGRYLPIPAAAIFLVLMFIVGHVVARYRRFGRNMYAVGSNRAAAEAAGIDSQRVILAAYIVSGLFAALAGLLEAGRMDSATPRMGAGMIFSVQAAAVIGGISLFGGRGTMIGAFGGVLLWGILDTGLNILQVSPFWVEVSRGLLLLFAVFLDATKARYLQRVAIRSALIGNPIGL